MHRIRRDGDRAEQVHHFKGPRFRLLAPYGPASPSLGAGPNFNYRHPNLEILLQCKKNGKSVAAMVVRWQMPSNSASLVMTRDCQAAHRTDKAKKGEGIWIRSQLYF
jgi:hypothetical protein